MVQSKYIRDILTLLLDGIDEGHDVKGQLDFITETDFNYTEAGVYISFRKDKGIEEFKAANSNLILNGVTIKSSKLAVGADSTLVFKEGLIDYLEIWSYDGEYPKHDLVDYQLKQEWRGSPGKSINQT